MNKFIDIVTQEAEKSYLKVKVGAILIYRNKIISKGHNSLKKGFIGNKKCCPL